MIPLLLFICALFMIPMKEFFRVGVSGGGGHGGRHGGGRHGGGRMGRGAYHSGRYIGGGRRYSNYGGSSGHWYGWPYYWYPAVYLTTCKHNSDCSSGFCNNTGFCSY